MLHSILYLQSIHNDRNLIFLSIIYLDRGPDQGQGHVIEREPVQGQETGGQDPVEESQGRVHAVGLGPGINGLVTEDQGLDPDREIGNQGS